MVQVAGSATQTPQLETLLLSLHSPPLVQDDPNDKQSGTEQNILMNYKFPNY
jgi:hypothetical protein